MLARISTKTLMLGTAMSMMALSGCTTGSQATGVATAMSAADAARAEGQSEQAIQFAEQAVLAEPRNPAARAKLGAAYLSAGYFASAAEALDNALTLGDVSPRTALGFALASIANGDQVAAIGVLEEWRDAIPPADLGLAYALAGNPAKGAEILTNAIRAGENTPTARQNLAYAHALMGNWAAARIMAAEDVQPSEVDARISEWARMGRPEDYTLRVATLLGVEVQADAGLPVQLALSSSPSVDEMLAEATPVTGELPPLAAAIGAPVEMTPVQAAPAQAAPVQAAPVQAAAAPAPTPVRPSSFDLAFAEGSTSGGAEVVRARTVSSPVVQATPAPAAAPSRSTPQQPAAKPPVASPRSTEPVRAAAQAATGSHLAQLASYSSEAAAKRGWEVFVKRYPQLKDHQPVITKARVRGKIYYRLNAGGLAASSAKQFCSTLKADGRGCIAWVEGKPLPGTIGSATRVAGR